MRGISIIMCCYNSAKRLPMTLNHLANQATDNNFPWEVILVDNNSTDNTSELAKELWNTYGSPTYFNVVPEVKPGLSFARIKGINQAKYEYLIFCDDDNWLYSNYITTAFDILDKNSNIGVAGGQSQASTDGIIPHWFNNYKESYVVGKQGVKTGDLSYRGYLWGAGIIIRKSVFLKLFSKIPPLLCDRKETILTSGGDSEICKRFLLAGFKLFYSEELKFTHFIPANRLTIIYRDNLIKGFKEAGYILNIYDELIYILNCSGSKRLHSLTGSIIKIILERMLNMNKWDIMREKRWVYFISGLNLNVDDQSEILKKLFYLKRENLLMSYSKNLM